MPRPAVLRRRVLRSVEPGPRRGGDNTRFQKPSRGVLGHRPREHGGGALEREDFVELDSTTAEKFSRHLIARPGWNFDQRYGAAASTPCERTGAFASVLEIGAFAAAFVEYARRPEVRAMHPDASLLDVRNSNGGAASCVDFAVYAPNRAFRLMHSSKFRVGVPFHFV